MLLWLFGKRKQPRLLVPIIKRGKHGWSTTLRDKKTGKHWALLSGHHKTLEEAADAIKDFEKIELCMAEYIE